MNISQPQPQPQTPSTNVDNFLSNDNFIVKKRGPGQPVSWENFDTIILDADSTIWTCVNGDGDIIGAYQTVPPYTLGKPDECYDSMGNKIKLRENFKQTFEQLKNSGKSIYMVTHSENQNLPQSQQPVYFILQMFGIQELFDDIIIDGDELKSESVEELQEGNTAFVDNDINNLSDVANNTVDVVPIDAKKIKF